MKQLGIILFLTCLFFACEKEEYSEIPYAPVRLELDLNLYEKDTRLKMVTGYAIYTTQRTDADMLGYGGILVCKGLPGIGDSPENLWAFDLACPVEARKDVKIVPDDSSGSSTAVKAICPKCGASYDIVSGGIALSGSKYNLTRYTISSIDGKNRFRVSN